MGHMSIDTAAERIADILLGGGSKRPCAPKKQPPPLKRPPIIGVSTPEELAERARIAREKRESAARRTRKPRAASAPPRVLFTCPCGSTVLVPAWRAKDIRYCSNKCKYRYADYNKRKARYPEWTPEMDAEVRRVYTEEVQMGKNPSVRRLAERLGQPRWRVSRRATELGVVQQHRSPTKASTWSEAELAILRECSGKHIETIHKVLAKSGYRRSPTAIKIKLNRTLGAQIPENYSACRLGALMGIDPKTICRWALSGTLKAGRRSTQRTQAQGGDPWEFCPDDVRTFIIEHVEYLDMRRVDKFWLVDLLTKGAQ